MLTAERSPASTFGQTFTYTCDNYVAYTCIRHLHMQAILLRHLHMRPLFLHDLHMLHSGFRGGVSGWGRDDMRPAWYRGTPQQGHFHMHTPLFGASGWGFGVGFRGFGVGLRGGVLMTCAPHGNVARHSKDTSTCTLLYLETSGFRGGASGWGFGVGFRGFGVGFRGGVLMTCAPHGNVARHSKDTSTCTVLFLETSGFRGGVSGWGRDDVRPAWKRGTPPARTLPHAQSSIWRLQGFRVGFRGGASGWGFGVSGWGREAARSAWKRGTIQQGHFHMHTPLFGDFRVSGWGFGVGFRGRGSGFRGGVSGWGRDDMRPAWKRGTPQQGHFHMHTPLFGDFRVSGWGFGVGSWWRAPRMETWHALALYNYASGHGMWNQHSNKPGSPWRKLVAIHNFVASAFLHYKISTQK